jgi:hypothetical protein
MLQKPGLGNNILLGFDSTSPYILKQEEDGLKKVA